MSNFKMTGEHGGNSNVRHSIRDRIVDIGNDIERFNNSLKSTKNKTADEVELYEATIAYLKILKKINKNNGNNNNQIY